MAKFYGNILSLSKNIARGATFLTHTVYLCSVLLIQQLWLSCLQVFQSAQQRNTRLAVRSEDLFHFPSHHKASRQPRIN